MNVRFESRGDLVLCHLDGELDINTAPVVKKTFDAKVVGKKAGKVAVNFKDVTYVDSSGLATLVEILKNMRQYGGKLKLCSLAPKIKSLFEITKLDGLFEILPDEGEAIVAFEK